MHACSQGDQILLIFLADNNLSHSYLDFTQLYVSMTYKFTFTKRLIGKLMLRDI